MRVLLVEDDCMIGEAVRDAMKDESYPVDWVKNGLTALIAVDTHRYDLVLLDLGLPGKDGQDVLRTVRAHDNPVSDTGPGIPMGERGRIFDPFYRMRVTNQMGCGLRRHNHLHNPARGEPQPG